MYQKLFVRAQAAVLTGNKMTFSEALVWNIHCFLLIYKNFYKGKSSIQIFAFIFGGITICMFQSWIWIKTVRHIIELSHLSLSNLEWILLLTPFPATFFIGWFVAIPAVIYLINKK